MADISKITLPSGNTYEIKDAVAREMISGGVSFIVTWDGSSIPVVANIPAGVVVTYQGTSYTGTFPADSAESGAFYLVKSSSTPSSEALDIYDEYVPIGTTGSKTWEKIGDTKLNLSDVVTGVTLVKTSDTVLGADTTFTASSPTVAFNNTTSDTFVKSVSAETDKNLVTTNVPNVTAAGSASTWNFAMGSGDAAETLIISGTNSVAPTLGTAITVATGETSVSGTGDAVVTGVTVGSSAAALTGLGSATVGSVTITVGDNDEVSTLTSNTDVSVTKGN